jgi:large repetitive protein
MANTFGGLSPVPAGNPIECEYLQPGSQDGALTTVQPVLERMAEYTASNFGGAMQGDILTTQWNGNVARVQLNSPGPRRSATRACSPASAVRSGSPHRATTTRSPAPSGSASTAAATSPCSSRSTSPSATRTTSTRCDTSSNGFTYGDLIDNGLDPCNPSQVPPDFDGDKVSDLNDPDIDGDGIPNADDLFPFDPDNGRGTPCPTVWRGPATWSTPSVGCRPTTPRVHRPHAHPDGHAASSTSSTRTS